MRIFQCRRTGWWRDCRDWWVCFWKTRPLTALSDGSDLIRVDSGAGSDVYRTGNKDAGRTQCLCNSAQGVRCVNKQPQLRPLSLLLLLHQDRTRLILTVHINNINTHTQLSGDMHESCTPEPLRLFGVLSVPPSHAVQIHRRESCGTQEGRKNRQSYSDGITFIVLSFCCCSFSFHLNHLYFFSSWFFLSFSSPPSQPRKMFSIAFLSFIIK